MKKLPTTFFKNQFPDGDEKETTTAEYSSEKNTYVNFDLNIGWQLETTYCKNFKKEGRKVYSKKCLGSVYCSNTSCELFSFDRRPASTLNNIYKQECDVCGETLARRTCDVKVKFIFQNKSSCQMFHKGNHTHGKYQQKHLTKQEKENIDSVVDADPLITPKAGTVGVSARTGGLTEPLRDSVAEILNNKDRTKYELEKSRERRGVTKRGDFLGELGKIQDEFDGFFVSCEVLKSKFSIVFSAPEMIKYNLSFSSHPLITDVTYKAVEDGYYLCSSVIFSPQLRKYIVIFQAVIGNLTAQTFETYFTQLFQHFSVNAEKFMGIVMDFSAAQIKGFKAAFTKLFPSEDPSKFLKGCYMHYMQSVQRIVSNYAVVPRDSNARFLALVKTLRETADQQVFLKTVLELSLEFPNCRKWLKWWLQPTISSMIFQSCTKQQPILWNHPTRTSNAVESYHSTLYNVMKKVYKQPLSTSLRFILQYSRGDGSLLSSFYEKGILPAYRKKPAAKKRKIKVDHFAESDSRAPDNNSALFTDKYANKKVIDETDDECEITIDLTKKRKANDEDDSDPLVAEKLDDDADKFFEKVSEVDLLNPTKELQRSFDEKINSKFTNIDDHAGDDECFESLSTQFRNALSSPSSPVASAAPIVLPNVSVKSDDELRLPSRRPASKPELKLPKKKKSDNSVMSQTINNDIVDLVSDDELEKDYRALEDPVAEFHEHVSYVRSITPPLITQNNTVLNSNTDGSCFIDATFEMLWHCVLPWVSDLIFDKDQINNSANAFDKILLRTYELHSSGTLEGRLEASKEIRNFVWSLNGYKKGAWDDCNKLLNLFLDNLSPAVRSFCSFSDVVRYKQCSVNEFHDVYAISRIPYFSFTCDFDKLLYRKATVSCQQCKEKNEFDGSGVVGRLSCRNILDETTQYPPFLFVCNATDFVTRDTGIDSNEDMPLVLKIEEAIYCLHGRVYAATARGDHFFSIGIVKPNTRGQQFLAKFDNLANANIRKLAEEDEEINEILSKKLNTVYLCYKKLM